MDVLQAAKQAMQQGQQQPISPVQPSTGQASPPPMGGDMQPQVMPEPKLGGLPVPPPQIALHLAQASQSWHPIVLGTLIWRALQEHGKNMSIQGV